MIEETFEFEGEEVYFSLSIKEGKETSVILEIKSPSIGIIEKEMPYNDDTYYGETLDHTKNDLNPLYEQSYLLFNFDFSSWESRARNYSKPQDKLAFWDNCLAELKKSKDYHLFLNLKNMGWKKIPINPGQDSWKMLSKLRCYYSYFENDLKREEEGFTTYLSGLLYSYLDATINFFISDLEARKTTLNQQIQFDKDRRKTVLGARPTKMSKKVLIEIHSLRQKNAILTPTSVLERVAEKFGMHSSTIRKWFQDNKRYLPPSTKKRLTEKNISETLVGLSKVEIEKLWDNYAEAKDLPPQFND